MEIYKIFLSVWLFWLPYKVCSGTGFEEREPLWSYWSDGGSANWSMRYPNCRGEKQSPVLLPSIPPKSDSIAGSKILKDSSMKTFKWTNQNKNFSNIYFYNTGRTAKIVAVNDSGPSVTGGCAGKNAYTFRGIHLHWGGIRGRGSEHRIDNRQYSGEVHLFFVNQKYSPSTAENNCDGLLVMAFFLHEVEGFRARWNAFLNPSTASLVRLAHYGVFIPNSISLSYLLQDIYLDSFLCYQGSTTYPPCHECVTWAVFPRKESWIPISSSQLSELRLFRRGPQSNSMSLMDNYREIQPLNGRTITYPCQ